MCVCVGAWVRAHVCAYQLDDGRRKALQLVFHIKDPCDHRTVPTKYHIFTYYAFISHDEFIFSRHNRQVCARCTQI